MHVVALHTTHVRRVRRREALDEEALAVSRPTKSGSLDEFFAANGKPGPRCSVCRLLERLDEPHASALRAALVHEDVQTSAIVRVLRRWGHQVSYEAVRRHRVEHRT